MYIAPIKINVPAYRKLLAVRFLLIYVVTMLGFTSRLSKRNRHKNNISNSTLVTKILEIFPDACPFYIRNLCIGRSDNPFDMDYVMRPLISGDYPKNQAYKLDDGSFEENLNILESIFPDADPNYLHYHAVLCLNDKNKLESFISSTLEKQDYPVVRRNESSRKNGQYYICNCCYDEEVKPRDLGTCESGCVFCKTCILRSVEIAYGEGKIVFSCLLGCSATFSLQTLEDVLPRKFYDKIAQKKQMEEVKAAQIENLEMCPFCDFAMIPAQEDKIFRCQNADCRKETCRLCKQFAHLPLRCDEVTKPAEIQKRIYIENKMSEALIRACYKCGLKFIKSEGCNRMKCSCGAMMCYLCLAPVQDYKHFNGPGGDNYHLCPLFSDTDELHERDIAKGIEKAKLDIRLNRHVPKTSKASPSKPPKPSKVIPAKSVQKPPTKTNKQKIPDAPPKKNQKRKAPPRPPPPVMQYISAIYTINNSSSSTQPPNNATPAVPLRRAPPPPPSNSKDNNEEMPRIPLPTSTNHIEVENRFDRIPEVPQRGASSLDANDNYLGLENHSDRIPTIPPRPERNVDETSVERQGTISPPRFNGENDINTVITKEPQNTDYFDPSHKECHANERPIPAPRRRVCHNAENKSDNILTALQGNDDFDLISFDYDSDEPVTVPQHTMNSRSFDSEGNRDELVANTQHTVSPDSFNAQNNIDISSKVNLSIPESHSSEVPIPAPRHTIAPSKVEMNSIISTETHQINNNNPFNLNSDYNEATTISQYRLYPDLFNLENSLEETKHRIYSHSFGIQNKYEESLPHSNSLESFNSEDSSDMAQRKPNFNPFKAENYNIIVSEVSSVTPS